VDGLSVDGCREKIEEIKTVERLMSIIGDEGNNDLLR